MRFVKISQPELDALRQLYESIMSYASHGLFYHEGMSLGLGMSQEAQAAGDYWENCRQILQDRGWVEDVRFEKSRVLARGSVEASKGAGAATCHRLRGILAKLYEAQTRKKVKFSEGQCSSAGASECVFQMEE
jgi:predicted hydrocarbon binding protein